MHISNVLNYTRQKYLYDLKTGRQLFNVLRFEKNTSRKYYFHNFLKYETNYAQDFETSS
jgi:hypothetical protein